MKPCHVTVIRGGISSEREVSLASGQGVIEALQQVGYRVTDLVANDDLSEIVQSLTNDRPDVIFNALHGRFGEDGTIQGVFEWMNIPYTHSGICASAIAMDKALSRTLLAEAGLPVAKGLVIQITDILNADPLPPPYVVKPLKEGSSVGVFIIWDQKDSNVQRENIYKNWKFGEQALVEEYIPGKELTVCVVNKKALTITDICPTSTDAHSFYDYDAKYKVGQSVHRLPAKIHPKAFEQALDYAQQAHDVLGCNAASRTDFRYDNTLHHDKEPGKLFILEVNTQPGMTPTSLLPEQAAYCGMSYPELCAWLVEQARCRT